jgi:hypothetical protein
MRYAGVVSSFLFSRIFIDAFNTPGMLQQDLIRRSLENRVVIGIGN